MNLSHYLFGRKHCFKPAIVAVAACLLCVGQATAESTPAFTNITLAGANIILRGLDGPPGGAYQMLRSPDFGQPLNSWLDAGLGAFDTSGRFDFTNSLPEDAAAFYRLLVVSLVSAPVITTQPPDRTTVPGKTMNFSVTTDGAAPLLYQWYFNTNTVLANETNATLTLTNVQPTNAGKYSVTVANFFGTTNSTFAALAILNTESPIGWASQAGGTTGGAGGTTQTVSTASAFISAVGASTPRVIYVDGFIDINGSGTGSVNINSNKTIIGLGTNAQIAGQLQISGKFNVILQNLSISNNGTAGGLDGVRIVSGSHHIWVDHCRFVDCSDGSVDTTGNSDYVTVSWCKFNYVTQVDHCFVNLVGASDTDTGNYRITFHHNYWGSGCDERQPMVRFGRVHVFNNYYHIPGHLGSCVKARIGSEILVENNYFENSRAPHQAEDGGKLKATGNVMVGTYGPLTGGSDTVFTPAYDYTLEDPATARAIIIDLAGNCL